MANTAAVEARYGPIVAVVNSASEPEKRYEVRHATDGTFSCQCMGYRFSKERPRTCRHTRATAAELASGQPITQPIGAPVAARPMPAATPQRSIREEAKAVAQELSKMTNRGSPFIELATNRIEAAIRAFLKAPQPVTMPVPTPVAAGSGIGIRYICLDD